MTETQSDRWARERAANEITASHRARGEDDGRAGRPVDPAVDQLDSGHRAVYLAGYSAGTGSRVEIERTDPGNLRSVEWSEGGSVDYWLARLSARTGTSPVADGASWYIPGAGGPSFRLRPVQDRW